MFTYQADAVVLEGAERDQVFARAVEADPGWAAYQAKTTRPLPVVALHPVGHAPPSGPLGDALKGIHDTFRRELAIIRDEVAQSGPGLGAQLRINCLTVCHGLHEHHTHEDQGMFGHLSAQHPELGPVVERLRNEHTKIASLIGELQRVINAEGADRAGALAEVERLTDQLEKHLLYEEQHLIPILNGITG